MYGYDIYHEEQMLPIIKSVQENKNSHAYIFAGEAGLKKHLCAELLACSLVCKNQAQAPCLSCPECVRAKAHTHPDISYITAPKDRKPIGVDTMRALSDDCFINPLSIGHKVYIIEGDELTEQAQNAFLKTLEEPPAYAVFIIICTDTSGLLTTVLSRCTQVSFPPLPSARIKEYIKKNYPDETRINFLANYAEGNPGKIDQIINDDNFEALRITALENLAMLMSERLYSSYKVTEFLEKNKENVQEIFNLWLLFLRDVILISEGYPEKCVNSDLIDKLRTLSGRFSPQKAMYATKRITHALEMLSRFVSLRAISLNLALSIKTKSY